jgi:hypothetical protein
MFICLPQPSFLKKHDLDEAPTLTPQERDKIKIEKEKEQFKKLLTQNEEQVNIRRGKALWKIVRRKRMVILMMARMGEQLIYDLDKGRLKDMRLKESEEE